MSAQRWEYDLFTFRCVCPLSSSLTHAYLQCNEDTHYSLLNHSCAAFVFLSSCKVTPTPQTPFFPVSKVTLRGTNDCNQLPGATLNETETPTST